MLRIRLIKITIIAFSLGGTNILLDGMRKVGSSYQDKASIYYLIITNHYRMRHLIRKLVKTKRLLSN